MRSCRAIVVGGLNTDFVLSGIDSFAGPGELVVGKRLEIVAGGKSRNIAEMMAVHLGQMAVSMVGVTVRDVWGLWKPPFEALKKAGVNTKHIQVLSPQGDDKLPGIALIPVDSTGVNAIYLYPGANSLFRPRDVAAARSLFQIVGKNNGYLIVTLELLIATGSRAIELAGREKIRVLVDPGGIRAESELRKLLTKPVFLIKPNQHEAEVLSGVLVTSLASAKKASEIIMSRYPVENVLITVGSRGAYLYSNSSICHFPAFLVANCPTKDETGCGDQVLASLSSFLIEGVSLVESCKLAIVGGGLQFCQQGVKAIRKDDILKVARRG